MPMMIECNTDDLEILLEGAKETGDCMLILHTTDDETVCLRARYTKKPGRPRKQQPAAAAAAPATPIAPPQGEHPQTLMGSGLHAEALQSEA